MAKNKATGTDVPVSAEELMKKYDRESNVRIWEGVPGKIIRYLCAAFSLYNASSACASAVWKPAISPA